jgi:hypothetical protein
LLFGNMYVHLEQLNGSNQHMCIMSHAYFLW